MLSVAARVEMRVRAGVDVSISGGVVAGAHPMSKTIRREIKIFFVFMIFTNKNILAFYLFTCFLVYLST